jgi:hypothetical protein
MIAPPLGESAVADETGASALLVFGKARSLRNCNTKKPWESLGLTFLGYAPVSTSS